MVKNYSVFFGFSKQTSTLAISVKASVINVFISKLTYLLEAFSKAEFHEAK